MDKKNLFAGYRGNITKTLFGFASVFLLIVIAFGADAARPRPQIRFANASNSVQSGEEAVLQILAPGASSLALRFVCPREISVGSPSGELCGTNEFPPQTASLTVRLSSSSRFPRLVTVLLDTRDASGRRLSSASARIHILPRKQPAVKVSLAASPVPQTVTRGANMLTFANLVFNTMGSGEDIRITSAQLDYQFENAADLNNCQLFDGTTALNTGSNVVNPVGVSGTYTFTLDNQLIAPKNAFKVITLKCNVSASSQGSFAEWSLSGDEAFSAIGGTTGASALLTVAPSSSSHRMTFADSGVLTVSLDSSSLSLQLVEAGRTNVPVAVFKLHALNEAIQLDSIALQFDGTNLAALQKVTLWDGATKVGEAVFAGASRNAVSTLAVPVVIPRDGDKLLAVKADLALIGTSQPANAGDEIRVNFDGDAGEATAGVGMSSGILIHPQNAVDTQSSGIRLFKSVPTVAISAIPGNTLTNGTMVLYRFSVVAGAAGDVSLGKLTFLVSSSTLATTSNFNLYGYSDSAYSVQAYASNPINMPTALRQGGELDIFFNPLDQGVVREAIVIPAGATRYFELRASVSGSRAGDEIRVSLLGDTAYSGVGTLVAIGAGASDSNNFFWSGNSTTTASVHTPDWSNGTRIPGLPASGTAAQVLSK